MGRKVIQVPMCEGRDPVDVRQKLKLVERWVELRSTPPPPRERKGEPVTIDKVALSLDGCRGPVPLRSLLRGPLLF